MLACEEDGEAYHWFRQNPDGTWSQKMGENIVTNKEHYLGFGDSLIWDPQSANIGEGRTYTDVLYYAVTSTTEFLFDLPEEDE